jgi:hypothetical protein
MKTNNNKTAPNSPISPISFVEYYQTYLRFGVGKFVDGIGSEWNGTRTIFNQHGGSSIHIRYVDYDEYYDEYVGADFGRDENVLQFCVRRQ